jgi:hypothetical protein
VIVEGDAVRLYAGEKDGRPGVVVRVRPDGRAFVLFGTGTARTELAHVLVRPRTAAGSALRLEKDTYFYTRNSRVAAEDQLERLGVQVPPELLASLRRLIGA